jgi:hypothetical protein
LSAVTHYRTEDRGWEEFRWFCRGSQKINMKNEFPGIAGSQKQVAHYIVIAPIIHGAREGVRCIVSDAF